MFFSYLLLHETLIRVNNINSNSLLVYQWRKLYSLLLRHLSDPTKSNLVSKVGDSLSPVSLGVSAEGGSATMLHSEFPKAGQREMLGAEVQPKKVLTPGFTALLFIQEAKSSSQGAVWEKQERWSGRCSWLEHPPGKRGTCDAGQPPSEGISTSNFVFLEGALRAGTERLLGHPHGKQYLELER